MKASAPLAPFSSAGVERTGLNMFGTFCRVSAVLVCGDHGEPGAQVKHSNGAVGQIGQRPRVHTTPERGLVPETSRMSF